MLWKYIWKFFLLMVLSLAGFIVLSSNLFISGKFDAIAVRAQTTQSSLLQHPQIQSYFNYNSANTYTDPYRKVTRRGDNLEAVILEQIASAQKSIDLAVQVVTLPSIAQAVVEKHKSGVRVRWITENTYVYPWGSLSLDEAFDLSPADQDVWAEFDALIDEDKDGELSPQEIAELEIYRLFTNNGVPWIDDTADGSQGSDLMHHKFMVIDGQKVITGSANFTLSSLHGDSDDANSKGNVENLIVIDSPKLAELYTQEFELMWGDGPGGKPDSLFGLKKPDRTTQTVQVGDAQVQVHFSPTSAGVPYQQTSGGMIGSALSNSQKSVDLAQFVFSDQELSNLLGKLYQDRNILLRGIFHSSFASQRYSSTLDMWGLKIADAQCKLDSEIYPWPKPAAQIGLPAIYSSDKLHHKFAVIDNETVILGSQNWSNAGNRDNDENTLVIRSGIVAAHFRQEIERLLQGASLQPSASLQAQVNDTLKRCGNIAAPPLPTYPSGQK
jgi:phosphatidylserine/phosphatidylglycerophosphate/cardiolipin synthase-like enzyme